MFNVYFIPPISKNILILIKFISVSHKLEEIK